MPFAGPNSERILILAPHGRDAEVASRLLQEVGWPTWTCADVRRLCEELSKGAAVSVVVEEALETEALLTLADWVRGQPPWSDFPFVVLTGRGDTSERNVLAKQLQDKLGNVTFLERPFHPTTFVSVVRSALRSRLRQYYAREVLERRDLLARELQHRTKNLLAVIQAIASASLQESPGREAFFNRLHALAKAQDLIIEGAGHGALMTDVVKNALESFGTRVVVEGPQIFLNANAAQGFALIMHELGTNAAKHGSLTRKSGTVSVRWSIDASATEPTIVFQWRELGGPTVTPPKRKGFGTILLERAVPTSGIPPSFDYSPEGFSYEVRATLTQQPD